MKWSEGHIHMAMRSILKDWGWRLVAGEYPGGTDHELYPLNVVDPTIARDCSPDPRRHSLGELIPDLVALSGKNLIICEAKVSFDAADHSKLLMLVNERRKDLMLALNKFACERGFDELLPTSELVLYPTLVFLDADKKPKPSEGISHFCIQSYSEANISGPACKVIHDR